MGRSSDAKEKLMEAVSELIWTGSYHSTTIDQICERAQVKKGSFYYFFDSKAALAEASLEAHWPEFRSKLDSIFSPTVPPLQRIRDHCAFELKEQAALKERHGHVLGCPLCTLGAEVSTSEDNLRQKVQEIMGQIRRYYETAIRDAHAAGLIDAPDPVEKSGMVFTYMEGLLTQARIQNDVTILKGALKGIFTILGVKEHQAAAA